MTRLVNIPDDFPAEAVRGLVLANKRYVKAVYGGVVRSTATRQGKVALTVGGGSGHYPAFAGWVGQGFADGAVCGNIFASPSGAQAYSVMKAAERGAGVFIGFGNYAGDVLHFGQAVERLRAEGIDARTLVVTDDIASGPKDDIYKRRGIAGDMPTFKVVGAACEAGYSMDEVEAVFDKVNLRTRSFGVAFAGCTLPGASEPLFTVEPGTMGVGLGIHGEPGVSEAPLGTADEVAKLLVDGLLDDRPEDSGTRVVAILNGLGSTKYEELFVTYGNVVDRLEAAGIEIVEGEAGEFVTSLDMAGVSLTLVWLDDEIEKLWTAPCDTPAYRRGSVGEVARDDAVLNVEATAVEVTSQGSEGSRALAERIAQVLKDIDTEMHEAEAELGKLDSVAGDGDHGQAMALGSRAAAETAAKLVEQGAGAQTLLTGAGAAWSERAGGTSGALWGALLTAVGSVLGDDEVPGAEIADDAVQAALDAVVRLGGAQVGDKTLVDALSPLVDAFKGADGTLAEKAAAGVQAADKGVESTVGIAAKLGRSRPLGEKSIGHPDPGATSLARVAKVVAERL